MARIRSVHPDLCRDEDLADVSAEAERTFVRLWPHLDDSGRALDNPRLLKADLYPLHDTVTADDVDRDLDELNAAGKVIRYVVDGVAYVCAKPASWAEYQKPRHPQPSKFPGPEEGQVVTSTFRRNGTADGDNGTAGRVTAQRRDVHAGEEGRGVDVGEGGAAPERLPQQHDLLLPPGCAPSLLDELDTIVEVLFDRYSAIRLDAAVQTLVDQRRRFPWPSDVRKALEGMLGNPSSDPARPRLVESVEEQIARLRAQLDLVDDEADRDGIRALIADLEGAA